MASSIQTQKADEYPRPQLRREQWESLNGEWDFYIDELGTIDSPVEVPWDRTITVPFSPETRASGVEDTGLYRFVWYRRAFSSPSIEANQRLLLQFEAVDYSATVWVNGRKVVTHQGGYSPFSADVTSALEPGKLQNLILRAEDDPADLEKPRGKQDWKLEPHSIWYPRTTGIWQSVWMEVVPRTRIQTLRWSSSLERWDIGIDATVSARPGEKLSLRVELGCGEQTISSDRYSVILGEVHRRIALSDPGIDDSRNELLWSPSSPTLLDAQLTLLNEADEVVDQVSSYAAMRSVCAQGDRFLLNSRPLYLRMVLDQGYWPESGLTPANDEALIKDIEIIKSLGFNGVRKHQKIESQRFLYWADKLGLIVWEEMPSAYRYTTRSIQRLTSEWGEIIQRDWSHPCIVAWVPFNESWGVPDLPESPSQRHYVEALYHWTKSIDSSRPVIGNDGWENVATDIVGIHDYDASAERIRSRYDILDIETHLLKRERPGGRMLLIDGNETTWRHPIMLTEFGGIAFGTAHQDGWGYSHTASAEELQKRYTRLLRTVRDLPALAGFCYTQLTDTYQEVNGLLFADRTPKIQVEAIWQATAGLLPDHDTPAEAP